MARTFIGRNSVGDSEFKRLVFWAAGLIVFLLATTTRVVGAEPSSFWRSEFKSAMQEAEERRVPLVLHFYADWCMPCQRMEREVLSTSTVKDSLNRRVVAVKINSDKHQNLVQRFEVETLPSDVILDPLSGKVITTNVGFLDSHSYVSKILSAESRFSQAHAGDLIVAKAAEQKSLAEPAVSKSTDAIQLGDLQPVVGLDGFSPVALVKNRQWNHGSAKFAWTFKGVTYYLSSREELVEFRANPETYAPRLLGCDPVILWESDKAVAGDIRFGAFFDDELYLFKTEDRRRQFKSNPEKFIRQKHALKAEQIERTAMR